MKREVTLKELKKCAREYRKVDARRLKDRPGWYQDVASLKLAMEHAAGGKVVYVEESMESGEIRYILSDEDTHNATVCANSLGKPGGFGKHYD